jgi:hypothetical protein
MSVGEIRLRCPVMNVHYKCMYMISVRVDVVLHEDADFDIRLVNTAIVLFNIVLCL